VAASAKPVHVDLVTTNVKEGGPNTEEGLSICTPINPKHTMGLMLYNNNGGSENNYMVYSRKRRFQKKIPVGQPSPIKVTPIRLGNSQTQHPQGTMQEGLPTITKMIPQQR